MFFTRPPLALLLSLSLALVKICDAKPFIAPHWNITSISTSSVATTNGTVSAESTASATGESSTVLSSSSSSSLSGTITSDGPVSTPTVTVASITISPIVVANTSSIETVPYSTLAILGTGTGPIITSNASRANSTLQGFHPPSPTSNSSAIITPLSISPNSTAIWATNTTAPFGNFTAKGTGTAGSGPPCTVNIPSANIDWWYAATYMHPLASLSGGGFGGRGAEELMTVMRNPTTFDVTSAMVSDTPWIEMVSYDPDWDITWTWYDPYTVTPSATITSVVTQLPETLLPSAVDNIPRSDLELYIPYESTARPATLAITGPESTVYVATSTTPVLYFSAYEVETALAVTHQNGKVGIATTTSTVELPHPYAYPYWIKGIEDLAVATGSVPEEFLKDIDQSSCTPGSVQAVVTVLVVVNYYYANFVHANPFLIHVESSVLGFEEEPPPETSLKVFAATKPPLDPGVPFTMIFQPPGPVSVDQGNPQSTPNPETIPVNPNLIPQTPAQTPAPNTQTEIGHNDGGNPGQLFNSPEPTSQTVGTIGTAPVVVGPSSVVVVGSQTLTPGGPAITEGGTPVSLDPSATAIIIGGSTSRLPPIAPPAPNPTQNPPPPILTVGSSTLTPNAATQFFIRPGETLTPGGTAVVDGTTVSLAPSASFVVIGGSTQILPTPPPSPVTAPPSIIVGGSTFAPNPGSTFVIGGQTLVPGQVINVDGTTVSLGPSASFVVINGATSTLAAQPSIVVGGSTITANPGSNFVIGGQTLSPNQILTIDGTTVSLGPSASFVVVNGVTTSLAAQPSIIVGGSTFVANPESSFIINGQTLVPGQAITVDGTIVSLGPSASFVVINGVTSTLSNPAAQITAPPLTIGNGVFTALPGSGTTYRIDNQLLTPGGVITVAGTTISLAPGATAIIINGQTTLLHPSGPITEPPILTIGSHTFTALPGTGTTFVIDGQTLTPGGTITVSGLTISLAPGATELIFGSDGHSTTTALFPATTTRSQKITSTAEAFAGPSVQQNGPAETSSKGAAYSTAPLSGFESWIISLLVAIFGLALG